MMASEGVAAVVGFLEARIGEDQAAAEAATGSVWTYGPYEPYEPSDEDGVVCDDDDKYVAQTQYDDQTLTTLNSNGNGVHIARWDPARVLAECAAKRRIIDLAFAHAATIDGELGCCHSAEAIRSGWVEPDFDGDTRDPLPSGCYGPPAAAEFLHVLAEPFAGHADFDPAWRLS